MTVSATCTDAAYDTQDLQTLVTEVLTQAARQQLGTGYRLSGQVQATVLHQARNEQPSGKITLQVQGTGTWSYQFDETALAQLAGRIAGKSKQQAIQVLLHTEGVSQVSLSLSGESATLPTDAKRIQMLVLLQAG